MWLFKNRDYIQYSNCLCAKINVDRVDIDKVFNTVKHDNFKLYEIHVYCMKYGSLIK